MAWGRYVCVCGARANQQGIALGDLIVFVPIEKNDKNLPQF